MGNWSRVWFDWEICVSPYRTAGAKSAAHDVIFPGKEYTNEEILALQNEHRFDGWLFILPTSSGISESYVPETQTTKTKGTAYVGPTGYVYYRGKSTTSTSGGYNVTKPWANFTIQLLDIETGEFAWYATAKSGGNALASFKTVVRSVGGQTVAKLEEDGIIAKKQSTRTTSFRGRDR